MLLVEAGELPLYLKQQLAHNPSQKQQELAVIDLLRQNWSVLRSTRLSTEV